MPKQRFQLTADIEKSIVAYIRAGGFAHVAAEAAGVPAEVFDEWLKKGESPRGAAKYRAFADAVRQAIAHARLTAEIQARDGKPLDWLRGGPGRHSPENPGWTGPARAPSAESAPSPLMTPEVQRLIAELLAALGPHPEARAAVAAVLSAISSDSPPK